MTSHAPTGESTLQPALFSITLDVQRLAVSCEFYRHLLGYEVVETARPGMIYETRRLRSCRYPAIELILRAAFGRRVGGSQCGGLLNLGFTVENLSAAVESTVGVRWVNANPGTPPPVDGGIAKCFDPDGYVIELRAAIPRASGIPATV